MDPYKERQKQNPSNGHYIFLRNTGRPEEGIKLEVIFIGNKL
jgi:hypothetical protein